MRPYSVNFTLTKSDWLQVFGRGINWKSLLGAGWIPVVALVILVETHSLDWLFPSNTSASIQVTFRIVACLVLTALLAYYVAFPMVMRLLQLYQLWRHPATFLGDRTITITDTQVQYSWVDGGAKVDWNAFKYRLENDRVFSLHYVDDVRGDTVMYIPKRAFHNAEQLSDFTSLLEQWVPEYDVAIGPKTPTPGRTAD